MKLFRLFLGYVCCCFFFFPVFAEEQKNPFAEMVGKPYAEYVAELRFLYWQIDRGDSIQSRRWLEQVREVAETTGSSEWHLEARLFEISYRFREEFRDSPLNTYRQEDAFRDLETLSREAEKEGQTFIYLRTLRSLMNFCYNLLGNYEDAFEYARLLNRKLADVDAAAFPDKLQTFKDISLMYYRFRDYGEAAFFLKMIIENETVARSLNLIQSAYNDMGLVYRNHWKDLAASDSCFRKVLEMRSLSPDSIKDNLIWEAIAKGNLGYNHFLRGEWEEAIPLLEFSYRHMITFNDYHHASGTTISLAEIFLQRRELHTCRTYIDLSYDLISRSIRKDRWRQLYPVMSQYYTLTGNREKALAYMDSTVTALETYYQQSNLLQVLRAEQRTHRMEQRVKEEELHTEKIRSRSYRNTAIIVSVGFLLLTALLIYTNILYRKRREAYRELVRKAREWASQAPDSTKKKEPKTFVMNEISEKLVERLHYIMEEKKPYLSPHFCLEDMADLLGTDRHSLSQFINQYTGKNFNNYINEYRVREAVRLLDDSEEEISFNTISLDSGFNNRVSFYRSFKRVTGLSPTTFRQNKQVD